MAVSVYKTVKKIPVSSAYIIRVVEAVLSHTKSKGDISVHCIGEKRMHRLNFEHRGKDRPTDVLSFAAREGEIIADDRTDIGDIFLCVPYIARQAKDFEVSVREEFTRMLVHGVLHALGYDHITKKQAAIMFPLQETFVMTFVS